MITPGASTLFLRDINRTTTAKLQVALAQAEQEVTSGTHSDLGVSLGYLAGQDLSLKGTAAQLQTITDTNKVVTTRLDGTQAALKALSSSANTFLNALLAAQSSQTGALTLQTQAKNALEDFTGLANSSSGGSYLFAGINSSQKPINAYFQTPPSASQQAVAFAFQSAFGVSQSQASAQAITPASMQSFLTGGFAGLFQGSQWTSTWSKAADQPMQSAISQTEQVTSSVSANDKTFGALAQAYTMVADLGVDKLNPSTFQTVVSGAIAVTQQAIEGLNTLQSGIGVTQARVEASNDNMAAQISIINTQVGNFENVDTYQASTRVNALTTQLQTSYSLTAQIQKLSLLNYLSNG